MDDERCVLHSNELTSLRSEVTSLRSEVRDVREHQELVNAKLGEPTDPSRGYDGFGMAKQLGELVVASRMQQERWDMLMKAIPLLASVFGALVAIASLWGRVHP